MKIGINGYEAVIPRFGFDKNGLPNRVGSAEVCFEILKELERLDKKNEYIIYLPTNPSFDLPKERENWKYKIIPHRKLWTLLTLKTNVNRDKLDLFFNPTHYSPLFLNCPQIITVLDVSYKYFPELFKKKDLYKLNLWGKASLKRANGVITISQSSKDDIIKEYKVSPSKITVIHPGIKEMKASYMNKQDLFDKYNLKNPYILFVGTLQPRKNIVRLIEAFSKLLMENIDLVVIGRKGWHFGEILKAPHDYGISDRVHFLENVTDEELPSFYKNAQLFCLPSLYEGFGLPVLEAMKYGCPVITSNVSSLPEAGGDAVEYVDPESVENIASKLKKVLKDKKLREKMVKRGHEQVKKFSWEKSAHEVMRVFEDIR